MRGLYAIVDTGVLASRRIDPVQFAVAILEAKPAAVQLRAKQMGAREMLALLRALAPACHQAGVPLVANDRADLAAFAGCDMVHVGQDDISIHLVRRIAPRLGVGVSTHDLVQLAHALEARPTYVAYGPVFTTDTKADAAPPVGIEGLRRASEMSRQAGVPLVAIGGITLERAGQVAAIADACAVIGGLLPAPRSEGDGTLSTSRGAALHDVTARAMAYAALYTRGEGAAPPPREAIA